LEKERPDALEVAAQAHQAREAQARPAARISPISLNLFFTYYSPFIHSLPVFSLSATKPLNTCFA